MKRRTFVYWSFLVITNKSERICFNGFGDSVIQMLKSGKRRASGLVSMLRQKKPAHLFLVFSVRLET